MNEGELIRPSAWGYMEFRQTSLQGPTESGRDPLPVHSEDECRTVSPPKFVWLTWWCAIDWRKIRNSIYDGFNDFCFVFDSFSSVYFYVLISLAHIPYRVMMVLLIVDDYKNNWWVTRILDLWYAAVIPYKQQQWLASLVVVYIRATLYNFQRFSINIA